MLIVLHICSLMAYDSGYTSLWDSETLVLYIVSKNQSKEIYCNFILLFHHSPDGSYIKFDSKPLKMIW